MIRGAIFDLDGTLCDTLADLADATNATLEHFGFAPRPTQAYRQYVGNGARKQLERALGQPVPQDLFEQLYAYYLAYYRTHYLVHTRAYEGLPAVLAALKARGVTLAVVTNKPQEMAQHIVQEIYGDLFALVRGQTEGFPLKPDPALTRWVMEQLCLTPEETVFVGDSAVDMHTARNAGLTAVGVTWGFRGQDELSAAGARYLVSAPSELLSVIQ